MHGIQQTEARAVELVKVRNALPLYNSSLKIDMQNSTATNNNVVFDSTNIIFIRSIADTLG
jgi:hypothetical protein